VVLTANETPSINDITAEELSEVGVHAGQKPVNRTGGKHVATSTPDGLL